MSLDKGLDLAGQLGLSQARAGKIRIIAVGNAQQWKSMGKSLPSGEDMRFVSFSDMTPELLEEHEPKYILSPVVAQDFDCIDLAVLLHRFGFEGVYRALSTDFPSPEIIEREISQLCRGLDFAVIMSL